MSTTPTVDMIRRVIQLADSSVVYEVTTTVTDPGDLPFVELFVASITDTSAEKTDVLAQVVTPFQLREITDAIYIKVDSSNLQYIGTDPFVAVADVVSLTQLPRDRTTAIQQGSTTYLTSTVTLQYTTVTAAIAAYKTLLARLSQLVLDWRSFTASFKTNPDQSYPLPQVSISVESLLIAAFNTAQAATTAAQATRDNLQAQKDACSAADAANDAVLQLLTSDIAFLKQAKLDVVNIVESGTLILTGGTTLTAPGTYSITPSNTTKTFVTDGSNTQSYESLLNTKIAAFTALQAIIATHDAGCGLITRQLADAQIAVSAAQTAQNTALAAVLAVCPTFNPVTGTS